MVSKMNGWIVVPTTICLLEPTYPQQRSSSNKDISIDNDNDSV